MRKLCAIRLYNDSSKAVSRRNRREILWKMICYWNKEMRGKKFLGLLFGEKSMSWRVANFVFSPHSLVSRLISRHFLENCFRFRSAWDIIQFSVHKLSSFRSPKTLYSLSRLTNYRIKRRRHRNINYCLNKLGALSYRSDLRL